MDFFADPEGHWVAKLDCLHGQHVRHKPQFISRPWSQTDEGRQAMLGTPLNCLKCERLELPAGLQVYKTTPHFDETFLPKGLRKDHSTKIGVWGRIQVFEGSLRYVVTAPFESEHIIHAGQNATIAPLVVHFVQPIETVKMQVEFLREVPVEDDRSAK